MTYKILLNVSIIIVTFFNFAFASTNQTLEWIDLIPEQERATYLSGDNAQISHNGPQAKQSAVGTIREDLIGKKITIPGFVIPLEGTETNITEFLLVPFVGACIHVPPPPPNQIIYVKFEEGAPMTKLWDVVYVTGELMMETLDTDLATTGYSLNANKVVEYQE
ncbi:DUF3299 domain-containing protein [Agarivorans aestuarii]|uniref:DUF3299 domain-containing protein n=1 Tax=Agarivorans aestuarii TaxID=1563703 RepID=UPI001C80B554|nr:DUF3299 domain-containing protein [Agarivorans aestuarii]